MHPIGFVAKRKGYARSLRSLRLPPVAETTPPAQEASHPLTQLSSSQFNVYGGERGIRTLDPVISGIHDFQSCPFGLSGISPGS
jgi:hypothetical protein